MKYVGSVDFCVAHVSRKERWTSIARMEASVGSLKSGLVFSSICKSRNRQPGCKSMQIQRK